MNTTSRFFLPKAVDVKVAEDSLTVELSDGRSVSAPLAWFPRLLHANMKERKHWRLIGNGHGIHWTDLDEDISVEGLLAGQPSGESRASFGKWLRGRATGIRTVSRRRPLSVIQRIEFVAQDSTKQIRRSGGRRKKHL